MLSKVFKWKMTFDSINLVKGSLKLNIAGAVSKSRNKPVDILNSLSKQTTMPFGNKPSEVTKFEEAITLYFFLHVLSL